MSCTRTTPPRENRFVLKPRVTGKRSSGSLPDHVRSVEVLALIICGSFGRELRDALTDDISDLVRADVRLSETL